MNAIATTEADIMAGLVRLQVADTIYRVPVLTIRKARRASVFVLTRDEQGVVLPTPVDLTKAVPA